jgi:acyl carrier protein
MEIQEQIRSYIVDNILYGDGRRFENDTPFHEGGILDSTGFLEIITVVEKTFDIKVADDEVVPENFDTLRKLSSFVERKVNGKAIA